MTPTSDSDDAAALPRRRRSGRPTGAEPTRPDGPNRPWWAGADGDQPDVFARPGPYQPPSYDDPPARSEPRPEPDRGQPEGAQPPRFEPPAFDVPPMTVPPLDTPAFGVFTGSDRSWLDSTAGPEVSSPPLWSPPSDLSRSANPDDAPPALFGALLSAPTPQLPAAQSATRPPAPDPATVPAVPAATVPAATMPAATMPAATMPAQAMPSETVPAATGSVPAGPPRTRAAARRAESTGPVRISDPAEAKPVKAAKAAKAAKPAESARSATPEPERPAGRAGRNLPMAIAVGVGLGALALVSLYTRPEAFVGVVSLVAVLAVWELAGAMSAKEIMVPVVPLAVGSVGMLVSAYVAGEEGLLVSFLLTCLGVLLWRVVEGLDGALRDVTAGLFVAAYVPLLAGFAVLMLTDSPQRVVVFILVTIASDIGGYGAGVLAGRRPMAPTISPKKTWEGFAGSVLTCLVVGVAGVVLLLDGPWWAGLALGAAAVLSATLGDLAESMLKRDLKVKDMGTLLPGHGGLMDRLDSLLPTAPVAFLILHQLVR